MTKHLSPRELEVLVLVADGLRNKEISERLFCSESTIKVHVHHIAAKFGVSGRTAVVAYALRNGVIR